MSRSNKPKFYAVKIGRHGPNIYMSWDETKAVVDGFPGARHRSFDTMQAAQDWLDQPEPSRVNPFSQSSANVPSALPHNRYGFSSQPPSVPGPSVSSVTPRPVTPWPASRARPTTPPRACLNNRRPIAVDGDTEMDCSGGSAATAIVIPDTPSPRKPQSVARPNSQGRPFYARPDPDPALSLHLPSQEQATPVAPEPDIIELSEEQQGILDKVKDGKSLFFTGSAGTGKSVLLRAIIAALTKKCRGDAIAVTAHTGIASVNIGGQTLYSFAGINLGKEPVESLLSMVEINKEACKRWRAVQTLVIDEISMVDGSLFDKLERIARVVRNVDRPFGGIQLVISGDFFQLPPVPERNGNTKLPVVYCFDALSWERCVSRCYALTRVFRQKDQKFVGMLNKMRVGELEKSAIEQFKRLARPLWYDDGIQPTQLFPLKSQVERANNERLNELPGPTYIYQSTDTPGWRLIYERTEHGQRKKYEALNDKEAERSLGRLVALQELTLRKDAQVMLIQNIRQGHLVNGSLGKVIGFKTVQEAYDDQVEIAKVDHRKPVNSGATANGVGIKEHDSDALIQAPKETLPETRQSTLSSNGRPAPPPSLLEGECTCGAEFEGGECSCGSGGIKTETAPSPVQDSPEQILASENQRWPVVQFTTGETVFLPPVVFSVVNAMGVVEAKRVQVPLILSYALSIHKSQGQTLQRVKIDLGGTFEKGQAYVALSRATSLQTLQVLNFNQHKVMAHPRVIEWSKSLKVHQPADEWKSEDESEDEFEDAVQELPRDSQDVIEINDGDAMDVASEKDDDMYE